MSIAIKLLLFCISLLFFGVTFVMGNELFLKEQIKLGEQLFAKNCAPCHGEKAIGQNPREPQGGVGKNGVLQAPALNGKGHAWHHPDTELFKKIKEGSFMSGSPMKGWEGRMLDEEIWAVIRYFQSLWPERLKKAQQQRN